MGSPIIVKHLATPYEQFLCDDNDKTYSENDQSTRSLKDLDCPDCIKLVWEILVEAMV